MRKFFSALVCAMIILAFGSGANAGLSTGDQFYAGWNTGETGINGGEIRGLSFGFNLLNLPRDEGADSSFASVHLTIPPDYDNYSGSGEELIVRAGNSVGSYRLGATLAHSNGETGGGLFFGYQFRAWEFFFIDGEALLATGTDSRGGGDHPIVDGHLKREANRENFGFLTADLKAGFDFCRPGKRFEQVYLFWFAKGTDGRQLSDNHHFKWRPVVSGIKAKIAIDLPEVGAQLVLSGGVSKRLDDESDAFEGAFGNFTLHFPFPW